MPKECPYCRGVIWHLSRGVAVCESCYHLEGDKVDKANRRRYARKSRKNM